MDGRLARYLLQGEGIGLEFKRCGTSWARTSSRRSARSPAAREGAAIDRDGIRTRNASRALWSGPVDLENLCPRPRTPSSRTSVFTQMGRSEELGSGTRNLYKFSRLYSGEDPVLVEGDLVGSFTYEDACRKMGDLVFRLGNGTCVAYVALDGNEVCGFVWAHPHRWRDVHRMYVSEIRVREGWRKRGIGTKLLRRAARIFLERPDHSVAVLTADRLRPRP